jgi:hypothetical protein
VATSEHSNEYVVAHAACPVCGAGPGEACIDDLPGVHAARHMVVGLPTLDTVERGRALRESPSAAVEEALDGD